MSEATAGRRAVTLTVTPDPGSQFTGWSGACTGTALTCKLTMSQSRSVKASFAGSSVPTYTLNVTGRGTGSGTVVSQAGTIAGDQLRHLVGHGRKRGLYCCLSWGHRGHPHSQSDRWAQFRWLERRL